MSLTQGGTGGSQRRRKKYKIVLLGEGRVGKTSILLRFCRNEYDGRQPPTLNASYMDKRIHVDGNPVQLSIWDTAGQERFHALGPIYYRDADAALLVYDITDADSFVKVQKWVRELRKVVGDDIAISIAGNKIDLEKSRHVDNAEAETYAKSVHANHFLISAKLNKGLEDCFVDLARKVLSKSGVQDNEGEATGLGASSRSFSVSSSNNNGNDIVLIDDEEEPSLNLNLDNESSGGCC